MITYRDIVVTMEGCAEPKPVWPQSWQITLKEFRKIAEPSEFLVACTGLPEEAIVILESGEPPRILVDNENNLMRFA